MAEIIQGEQLSIGFVIKMGTTPFTPSNCDDVRIIIGEVEKSYMAGELTYNTTTNKWEFPVTQSQTWKMDQNTMWQAEIKIGTSYLRTKVDKLFVAPSVLEIGA